MVSIGPYVLAGGEIAAMALCDTVIRKLPGALGHEESAVEESYSEALEGAPEYPHYTRPAEWRGFGVPRVLLSGNHAEIRALAAGAEPRAARTAGRSPASRAQTAAETFATIALRARAGLWSRAILLP